jgi:UPF0755 protein
MFSAKKTKPRVKWLRFIFIVGLIVGISLSSGLYYVDENLKAVGPSGTTVNIVVEKGDLLPNVLDKLEDAGLIQNRTIVRYFARYENLIDFKAGNYTLDYGYDVRTILSILNDASKANRTDVVVTIIPGRWAKHIAEILAEQVPSVSAEEMLSLWNDEAYIRSLMPNYSVLTEDIFNRDVRVLLEGYLLPETYFMNPAASADSLTRRILNQTQKVYDDNRELFENFMRSNNLSLHDVFILASIVQFEARTFEDMRMVSQVMLNRLQSNYTGRRLEVSASICYALYVYENWRECESAQNAQINSPYNTYRFAGLPIGPIDNPSKNTILATLQPIPNDYFFFIADVFGDGKLYYAKDLAGHQANIDKYLRR